MQHASLLQQEYDVDENIVFVTHPVPIYLAGPLEMDAYFDEVMRFWRNECQRRRSYYVIDWQGFSINEQERAAYAQRLKKVVLLCAITIVRYGTDPLQRAATRLMALKLHMPSNIYDTRSEAVAVVRGLREGSFQLGASF